MIELTLLNHIGIFLLILIMSLLFSLPILLDDPDSEDIRIVVLIPILTFIAIEALWWTIEIFLR